MREHWRNPEGAGEPGEREAGGDDSVERLEKALADEKAKAEEYLASWKRAQADFANLKRRTEQERAESWTSAVAAFLLGILPALDDMDRAVAAIPPELENDKWVNGLKMVWRKFETALETQGLCPLRCAGEDFDPRCHEAIMRCEGKEGVVMAEFEKGYKYKDRLLRPARVSVGEGEPESKEE